MLYTFNSPIDLEKIAESGQCFRWDQVDEKLYQIVAYNKILRATQIDPFTLELDCSRTEFEQIWSKYFDIDTNYSKLDYLKDTEDSFLREAYLHGKGIRILQQDPWEVLISFLISQQKTIPAIKSTITKISQLYGNEIEKNIYSFPTPEMFYEKGLDSLHLCSLGYREKYIKKAISTLYHQPGLLKELESCSDENLHRRLQEFYGVGPKVANCIRLFGYNRLDSFPEDVWIKRALNKYYPNGFPFEKHHPYNGIIQQYIFYYYRNYLN